MVEESIYLRLDRQLSSLVAELHTTRREISVVSPAAAEHFPPIQFSARIIGTFGLVNCSSRYESWIRPAVMVC